MKPILFLLLLASGAVAATAQAPARPATAKSAHPAAASSQLIIRTPPGLPVVKTPRKTIAILQYQDIRIGDGPVAEPNKLYTVHYTGWLASNGQKFDSSYDHRPPLKDKDGKPQLDAEGKPMLGPAEPITFPQGFGRVIPGFDQGVDGMRVGGKRRIFIPWQLAYGARGRTSPDATHVVIPPKSDLIFDVELVGVKDMPPPAPPQSMQPNRGMFGARPGMPFPQSRPVPPPAAPAQPAAPTGATPPPQPSAPATPAAPTTQQPK